MHLDLIVIFIKYVYCFTKIELFASLIDHWVRPHHASGGFCGLGCGADVSGATVATV